MILYHGSNQAVPNPKILPSERMLDFGVGFYTTTSRRQAIRWAIRVADDRKVKERVVSIYEFDRVAAEKELTIVRFAEPDEVWLKFVCDCRNGREPGKPYDMVFGPVADDQVYATVQLYEHGDYTKAEAIRRLMARRLDNQALFHTEKSLQFCRYTGHETVGGAT